MTISIADFDAAVRNATAVVREPLRRAERAASAGDNAACRAALSDLHAVLMDQLAVADALRGGGTVHTDGGGTGKGDGE